LAEFGITAAQGREGITELLAIVVQDEGSRLPVDARASLSVLAAQLQAVQTMIGSLEKRIVAQHRSNEASKRLETIPGIGVIGATTIAAVVPDWECSLKGPGRRPVPQVINFCINFIKGEAHEAELAGSPLGRDRLLSG
jgi:hypothetical protein